MLDAWHEFYLLLGTAAATLTALLFVAVSVGIGIVTVERAATTRVFMSPVIVHFTLILVVSLIALAPIYSRVAFALPASLSAAAGIIFTVAILPRLFQADVAWLDRFSYGLLPLLGYMTWLAAAILFWRSFEHSLEILAATLIILLIDNIRNAWDLTLYLVRQHRSE
jgi:hypothetical protein